MYREYRVQGTPFSHFIAIVCVYRMAPELNLDEISHYLANAHIECYAASQSLLLPSLSLSFILALSDEEAADNNKEKSAK